MKEKRISTGITALNKKIKGGFEENSINLIEGVAGAGKTIFAIQFLLDGVKKGEPGLYVTFEETKDKLIKHMKSLGWDLKKLEKQKKLLILEHSPEQVKDLLERGGGIIESYMEKLKAKRLVVDSITAFALLNKDELAERESCLHLFKLINRWGCTALLISEHDPQVKKETLGEALEFEVDSIILLYNSTCNKNLL